MSWLGHFIVAGRCPDGQKYKCPKVQWLEVQRPEVQDSEVRITFGWPEFRRAGVWMVRSPDEQKS